MIKIACFRLIFIIFFYAHLNLVFLLFLNGSESNDDLALMFILVISKFCGSLAICWILLDSLFLLKTEILRLSPWYLQSQTTFFSFWEDFHSALDWCCRKLFLSFCCNRDPWIRFKISLFITISFVFSLVSFSHFHFFHC